MNNELFTPELVAEKRAEANALLERMVPLFVGCSKGTVMLALMTVVARMIADQKVAPTTTFMLNVFAQITGLVQAVQDERKAGSDGDD